MIVSPNKVFSEYISGVLPELDEENILQCEADQIADSILPRNYAFEESWERAERIINGKDKSYENRTKMKSSREFCELLKAYVDKKIETFFKPFEITIGDRIIPKEFFEIRYKKYNSYTPSERVQMISEDLASICKDLGIKSYRKKLNDLMQKMYAYREPITIYQDFWNDIGKPEYFTKIGKKYEYADMFPLAYIEARFNIKKPSVPIKHLIIDEMQDYSPICYELINLVYDCNKTVLGDVSQSISGITNSVDDIEYCFKNAQVIKLNKSYRSTYEIIEFAKSLKPGLKEMIPVVRHGEDVKCINCKDITKKVSEAIDYAKKKGLKSIGIICKSKKNASSLYERLKEKISDISLIEEGLNTIAFISTVQFSKGLEFDYVMIVDADDENYCTDVDRDLLYVACTRAMHKLDLVYSNQLTRFVQGCKE